MVTLNPATLSVHILRVGDGDSIVVELPAENGTRSHLVIDCYKGSKTEDYLRALGAQKLKLVVATHPHMDHIAGLERIVRKLGHMIEQFWDCGFRHKSKTWDDLMIELRRNPNILFLRPTSGTTITMSGVEITVLAPSVYLRNRYDTYGVNINNSSIVLKLEYGGRSVILAGDAQWDSWAKMTEEFPHEEVTKNPHKRIEIKKELLPLKCRVLKVAHHGSKHGTALEAIERLKPKYAAISCGSPSRYDFPHELATGALKELKTKIYRTSDGSMVFTLEPGVEVGVEQYNDSRDEVPPAPDRP